MIKQNYRLTISNEHGAKHYYYKSQFHRLNGPAVIWPDGVQHYYVNNKLHRVDGPAVIHYDDRFNMYCVNHTWVSKEDFYQNYYQES